MPETFRLHYLYDFLNCPQSLSVFNTRETQATQMHILEKSSAVDASGTEFISQTGVVHAGGRMSVDEFVSLMQQPARNMLLLYQLVGYGEWGVDEARVMAKIEQVWDKPEKLDNEKKQRPCHST